MTTTTTAPKYDLAEMIARTREADKAKGRLEPTEERSRTMYWRMKPKPLDKAADIVRVEIKKVSEQRTLLGNVAGYVARWNDHDPPCNFPLDLSFGGELKETGTEKKHKIWHLETGVELPPEQRRPGKWDPPALLMLDIDYPRATALLAALASYFAACRTDPFEVTFTGKLVLDKG